MPRPGFEPGLLRPQRSVLTTRRSRLHNTLMRKNIIYTKGERHFRSLVVCAPLQFYFLFKTPTIEQNLFDTEKENILANIRLKQSFLIVLVPKKFQ